MPENVLTGAYNGYSNKYNVPELAQNMGLTFSRK
jgi:hypothetical protein